MTSIRGRLFRWLVIGMGIGWAVAGVALHLMIRSGHVARFDANLSQLAAATPLVMQAGERARGATLSRQWDGFFVPGSGLYLQVWKAGGAALARSPSLGTNELTRPEGLGAEPVFWDCPGPEGRMLRATAGRIEVPAGRNEAGPATVGLDVVVARDRSALDRILVRIALGITGVGLLLAFGFSLFVHVAVSHGLRPLSQVAEQAATISTSDLAVRFSEDRLPSELAPIVTRLNDLMGRLEEGFVRERRFSANLAHELRTPVAELKMAAEVALRWPDRDPGGAFRDVLAIAGQMQTIVESLLLLARPGSAGPGATEEQVDLDALARDCWRPFARAADDRQLRAEIALAGVPVRADEGLLRLVLTNLLSNAVEYTPPGGAIRLTRPGAGRDRIDVIAGNTVRGLTEEDMPRLFERFWRRDAARTGGRHHGLGLCVARAAAEASGCSLSAQLDPGGAWIEFRLRARDAHTDDPVDGARVDVSGA